MICYHFSPGDFRLLLEFFSMSKRNKQKLTVDLARKNETLAPHERYGTRGTTNPATMLKQLNRILKDKVCDEIAAFTPVQREEAWKISEKRLIYLSEYKRYEEHKRTTKAKTRRRTKPAR